MIGILLHKMDFMRLVLFYFLPISIIEKTDYRDFPRTPSGVFRSKKWFNAFLHPLFSMEIADHYARALWPHFGVRGDMENYSATDPLWCFAHNLVPVFEAFRHMGLADMAQCLMQNLDAVMPGLDEDGLDELARDIVVVYRKIYHFDEICKTVNEHRVPEDYDSHTSFAYIDFYRGWYHTRTKHPQAPLQDEHLRAIESTYNPIGDTETHIMLDQFSKCLKPVDQHILKLLMKGLNKTEIAKLLGYANHGAVCKRVERIADKYLNFIGG